MKKVIINADDFGLSEGINQGIIEAHRVGTLPSASIMANMPAFQNAANLSKENPQLGVGVHLNLVRGKAILLREASTLTNSNGWFYNFPQVLRRLLLGQFNLKEIEEEFRVQIRKVINSGLTPTHLDTEKHIHGFPSILKILMNLAREFNILKIRSFRQVWIIDKNYHSIFFDPSRYKFLFLTITTKVNRRYFYKYNIKTPDFFYYFNENKSELLNIFQSLKEGVSEIACHPGHFSKELEGNTEFGKFNILNQNRIAQLRLLLSPELRQAIVALKINLINYSKL